MKNIVETKGEFMLVDPYTGDLIAADRPSVCAASPFIESRTSNGQLKVLEGNLPAEANDADFLEFWNENKKSAVDAYLSTFEQEPKKTPKKKPSKDE